MTSQKHFGRGDTTSTWQMKLSVVTKTLMKFMIDNFVKSHRNMHFGHFNMMS